MTNDDVDLVLATRNRHKLRELADMVAPLGLRVAAIGELAPDAPDPVEDGPTFVANALIKALDAYRRTGRPSVADDSGLCVAALGGAPGVFSARWADAHGDDEANNRKLLAELEGVTDRRAHYHCALVLVGPRELVDRVAGEAVVHAVQGEPTLAWIGFEGQLHGTITDQRAGDRGFGYDPYFLLPERGATVAELGDADKHAISHRGKAFRALVDSLKGWSASS